MIEKQRESGCGSSSWLLEITRGSHQSPEWGWWSACLLGCESNPDGTKPYLVNFSLTICNKMGSGDRNSFGNAQQQPFDLLVFQPILIFFSTKAEISLTIGRAQTNTRRLTHTYAADSRSSRAGSPRQVLSDSAEPWKNDWRFLRQLASELLRITAGRWGDASGAGRSLVGGLWRSSYKQQAQLQGSGNSKAKV